jgi:ATP-dependent protease ClpP protease subunit
MGKIKDLRDHLDELDRRHEQSAKALALRIDQHARRIRTDLDRQSRVFAIRIVKLEKRIAMLERRARKAK